LSWLISINALSLEYTFYFWISGIIANLFLLRFVYFFWLKKRQIKADLDFSFRIFICLILIDSWAYDFHLFDNYRLIIYHSLLPSLFIFNRTKFNLGDHKVWAIVLLSILLFSINHYMVFAMFYSLAILNVLFKAYFYATKSANFRFLMFVYLFVAVFLFFALFQVMLNHIDLNWINSKFLIYFSIADMLVFTSTLLIIHVFFRRLFFN
jgi:hypothetical protein